MKGKGLIAAALLLTLAACASPWRGVPGDRTAADADAVLGRLAAVNRGLTTFKGIGKAVVTARGRNQTARVAWTGHVDRMIRIEVLSPAGRPLAGFADNGQWVTLVSHASTPPEFHKTSSAGANLKDLLGVPVPTGDVVSLIAGRVPVRGHRSARLELVVDPAQAGGGPGNGPEALTGPSLVLQQAWGGTVQRIVFDPSFEHPREVAMYGRGGRLVYRAVFEKMQFLDGYRVPSRLRITDDRDLSLDLTIHRYWVDIPVNPSIFLLAPPAGENRAGLN